MSILQSAFALLQEWNAVRFMATGVGSSQWTADDLLSILTLRNYNTRLVVFSAALLGLVAGVIGSFLLLRKRSLMADALSHASLPGIGAAFLLMSAIGSSGKSLPVLLVGAAIAALTGVVGVILIRHNTRVRDDAAMGIVLSVGFGFGVVLLGMIQSIPGASAAGLETFIYGKTASIILLDFLILLGVALAVLGISALLIKEFTLLCFDPEFAAAGGWPVIRLDTLLLLLVTAVTVAGMQAVGLILIIAFLIIPAAAARFWTNRLIPMLAIAAGIGAISGWLGAALSALLPGFPAGAIIVLTAVACFLFSMAFGSARGVVHHWIRQRRLKRKIGRQHLLRSVIELLESSQVDSQGVLANRRINFGLLQKHRSWSAPELRGLIRQARQDDHLEYFDGRTLRLSEPGFGEASRTTRNHRLWEQYLIEHADVAPDHVDRDADTVEHILSAELVRKLESRLESHAGPTLPHSPHPLEKQKGYS